MQKKINMFFGVVLISALMATVSTAPAVPAQVGCAEGEPKMGQLYQPDVNLTVLPSENVNLGTPVTITCDADVPRYPSSYPRFAPWPVKVTIRVGEYEVMKCEQGGKPVYQCACNLVSPCSDTPLRINCTAHNNFGECRYKVTTVTFTATPTATAAPATATLPTQTVTSTTKQVIPPITTTSPTTKKKDSDDDDDDDHSDESGDESGDEDDDDDTDSSDW